MPQSVSTRLLMLGWSIFSISSLLLLLLSDSLYSQPVSLPPQPLLYLAGSRQAAHLVQRVTMSLVQRQVESHTQAGTGDAGLVSTLHTSFLLLLLLLFSTLLISLCELVVFSWHNKGRQTGWAALVMQIKSRAARTRRLDQAGLDGQEGQRRDWNEDGDNCRLDKRLIGQEEEGRENTRL